MRRWFVAALALSALLPLYVVAALAGGIALIATGRPIWIAIGAAVLVLPALGLWLLVREWSLALAVQRMANELSAERKPAVDDLPGTPGGRMETTAADRVFPGVREAVERAPEDWVAWFNLAFAYDTVRNRRKSREALRKAARLRRAAGRGEARASGPVTDR
jgi:hypothetical protein